jgi:hypothetical protein
LQISALVFNDLPSISDTAGEEWYSAQHTSCNYCYSNITSISEDKYFTESQQFNKTFHNPFDSLCEGRAKIRQQKCGRKKRS